MAHSKKQYSNSNRNRTPTHVSPSELGIEGSLGMLQNAIGLSFEACRSSGATNVGCDILPAN